MDQPGTLKFLPIVLSRNGGFVGHLWCVGISFPKPKLPCHCY